MSPQHSGWRLFAAVMIVIAGTLNLIDGLLAVFDTNYVESVRTGSAQLPVTDNVETWGWTVLLVGVVMILAGAGILSGALWARTVGVVVAGINLIVQMTYMAHFPFWSFTMVLIDSFIIYGLIVYGGREYASA